MTINVKETLYDFFFTINASNFESTYKYKTFNYDKTDASNDVICINYLHT